VKEYWTTKEWNKAFKSAETLYRQPEQDANINLSQTGVNEFLENVGAL